MNHYLSIIRKADFIDLYKFGQWKVCSGVEFDGQVGAHAGDNALFGRLTEGMNPYEYSFEYVILHFVKPNHARFPVDVAIGEVLGVYALDGDAKREMDLSFDPRIKVRVSPWPGKFGELSLQVFKEQSMKGVRNLWRIFDLPQDDIGKCEAVIDKGVIDEVFRGFCQGRRPAGGQSVWTYLLRYERHSLYPRGMKGIFCDMIHVVCNWLGGAEQDGDVAEGTSLFVSLMDCSDDDFKSLMEISVKSPLAEKVSGAGCRFAVAAPLFLFMKDRFSDGLTGDNISQEFINYVRDVGGFECSVAVYMLGLVLGQDKTYDYYYECIKLPLFEDNPDVAALSQPGDGGTFGGEELCRANDSGQPQLFSEPASEPDVLTPPVYMRKGKGVKLDIKKTSSRDELIWLEEHGYTKVKKFTKTVREFIKAKGL